MTTFDDQLYRTSISAASRIRRLSRQISATTLALIFAAACTGEAEYLGEETASLVIANATFVETAGVPLEHCRVATPRLASWTAGRQLLIFRGSLLRGMCTVDATGHSAGNDVVQVNATDLDDRVAQSNESALVSISGVTVQDEVAGGLAPVVVAAAASIAELESDDSSSREYVSGLSAPGSAGVSVAYTAPHPWENAGTSASLGRPYVQWKAVEAARDTMHDGYWTVGFQGNDGDYVNGLGNTRRFHITATEISADSFPGLGAMIAAGFDYAVAFHGRSSAGTCGNGSLVGGGLGEGMADSLAWRRGIAENVIMLTNPDDGDGSSLNDLVPSQIRYNNDQCNSEAGTADANFVNRLARYTSGGSVIGRGIQLETGNNLSPVIYERIGSAVREVFDCLNDPADITLGGTDGFSPVSSDGVTYTAGRCRGFIAQVTISHAITTINGSLQGACVPGAKVHLDAYRWNTMAGSWDRVAGGTRAYTSCSPTVSVDAAYDDNGPALPNPSYQHVLSGDTSGTYRLVVHGYTASYFTPATALPVSVSGT